MLSHCGLHDLGFVGPPWTYNNNQGGPIVWVMLDRGVADTEWFFLFPNVSVTSFVNKFRSQSPSASPGSVFRCTTTEETVQV